MHIGKYLPEHCNVGCSSIPLELQVRMLPSADEQRTTVNRDFSCPCVSCIKHAGTFKIQHSLRGQVKVAWRFIHIRNPVGLHVTYKLDYPTGVISVSVGYFSLLHVSYQSQYDVIRCISNYQQVCVLKMAGRAAKWSKRWAPGACT